MRRLQSPSPNAERSSRLWRLAPRLLPVLLALLFGARAMASVLNLNTSFERPQVLEGVPEAVDDANVPPWKPFGDQAAGTIVLRRGSDASRGGQFLEIRSDGSDSGSAGVWQPVVASFDLEAVYRLQLRVRHNGTPPSGASGGLYLALHSTLDGTQIAATGFAYGELSADWQSATLTVASGPSHAAGHPLALLVLAIGLGIDPDAALWIDEVRLETDGGPRNRNFSFESPDISPAASAPAEEVALDGWSIFLADPNALSARLLRDGGAAGTAQALELGTDGSADSTHYLVGTGTPIDADLEYRVTVALRHNGTPPHWTDVSPASNLGLSLYRVGGSTQAVAIDPANLTDGYRTFATAFASAPPGDGGLELVPMLVVGGMGEVAGSGILVDDLRLEVRAATAPALVLNPSFEAAAMSAPTQDMSQLADWWLDSPNAADYEMVAEGSASDGAQHLRSWGRTCPGCASGGDVNPTSSWEQDLPASLFGPVLESFRVYNLRIDLRHNGVAPQGDYASRLMLRVPGSTGGDGHILAIPGEAPFRELSDEWQTFETGFQPIDPIHFDQPSRVQVTSVSNEDPASAVELDNVVLESRSYFAMSAIHDTWVVGNNVSVPNWFEAFPDADSIPALAHLKPGTEREAAGVQYSLDLPVGIVLEAVGAAGHTTGAGATSGIYDHGRLGEPFYHEGVVYQRYEIVPVDLHQLDGRTGPIYLRSNLPDGTTVDAYHRTVWAAGHSQLQRISITTRTFPSLHRPRHLLSSLWWMVGKDEANWPGFPDELGKLGFNTISSARGHDILSNGEMAAIAQDARARGFDVVYNEAPFFSLTTTDGREAWSTVPGSGVPVAESEACPSYRGALYQDHLGRIADHADLVRPDWLFLDIELYGGGAARALAGQCQRCNDYLSREIAERGPMEMAEALKRMGSEIALDIRAALRERVDAVASPEFRVPRTGYFHTEPGGFTYHHLFDFDALYAAGGADFAQTPYYFIHPPDAGDDFRSLLPATAGRSLFPILQPGTTNEYPSPRVYDFVNEFFGSGAHGITIFAFMGIEGADLYYYAKAMEALLPVEELIRNAEPVPGVTSNRPEVDVTAIRHGDEYLLLLSSYGRDPYHYSTRPYVLDPYEGPVTIRFPEAVSGTPVDLARGVDAGLPFNGRQLRLDFAPGVAGARTALYSVIPVPLPVPEPGSLPMLVAGVALLWLLDRRRVRGERSGGVSRSEACFERGRSR